MKKLFLPPCFHSPTLLLSGLAAVVWLLGPVRSQAYQFTLGDVSLELQEISTNVDVYFSAMRFNRAANEWNVDVTISNKVAVTYAGPVVLLVDSFAGTTGPLRPDGTSTNRFFYDFSGQLVGGRLAAVNKSGTRTIGLGFLGNATPQLKTRTFAAQVSGVSNALAFVRSLNQVGQPLPSVNVFEQGPGGAFSKVTDSAFGVVTLGNVPGTYTWKFARDGYLPVWRQATLQASRVSLVPSVWLSARDANGHSLTPLAGGIVSNQSVVITFGPGNLSQNAVGYLTTLNFQTLPALLPSGWSPLQAFWLELNVEPSRAVIANLAPWGPINPTERAVLARFDPGTMAWQVLQIIPGNGSDSVSVLLPGSGAYVLAVADSAPRAPALPTVGQPLLGAAALSPDPNDLRAAGFVLPASSPASTVPELVTAQADIVITNIHGGLTSGTLLRGEIRDSYLLSDGTHLVPPIFEDFVIGYQRPGEIGAGTLSARFPLRPLLLFGPQELNQGVVHMDLLPPGVFSGGVLDTNGGLVAAENVRLLAAPGTVDSLQAIELRLLNPTNFADLAGTNLPVIGAFEVGIGAVGSGRQFSFQIPALPANSSFVLARVLLKEGVFGLEPQQRLKSDANGSLTGIEPTNALHLPGLTGSGDYVLVQVQPTQDLITGLASDSTGRPIGGLPVRVLGQPWLTFSAADGSFKLLAPAGHGSLSVTDLVTGDTGTQAIDVPTNQTPITTSIASIPSALQIVSITPSNGAVSVPAVSSVRIAFSRPINPGTLVSNAVQLLGVSNQPVAVSVTLNLANNVATLLPNAPLNPATQFVVAVTSNIADTVGRPLTGSNRFTFTTAALSARDPAAQLIIYEPGATNVPSSVVASLPGYVPGTNKSLVVVQGTSGSADPGVPVIVVNEASGDTTTVLSKSDGSFASYVSGLAQDFISATFVSLNGSRIYVPVNRQLFDDGSVGLFPQGGSLQVQSDSGIVELQIPPNALKSRSKFKLETVSPAQLKTQLGGVTPDGAVVAAPALHIHVDGQTPSLPMQARFPVDLVAIGFPTNEPASNAVIALTAVRETQGIESFEVLDQMAFAPQPQRLVSPNGKKRLPKGGESLAGTIFTVSGFAPGAVGLISLAYDWIVVPTLMLGTRPVVVTGHTYYYQVADPNQGQPLISKQQLSGTYIVLRSTESPAIGPPGRLQPGWVYATSGADGSYSMIAPFAGINYLLVATHPQFEDPESAGVVNLIHTGGSVQDFVFKSPLKNQLAPRVTVANAPLYPASGQSCQVEVDASQALGGPPKVDVKVKSWTTNNLFTGLVETNIQVTLTNGNSLPSGNSTLWTGNLSANKPIRVVLTVTVTGKQSLDPFDFPINFAGLPPPPTNNYIPPPDTNDVHGPLVISTQPTESGFIDPSGTITIFFNKPIDNYVLEHPEGITVSSPGATVRPIVRLSPDQQTLTLQLPGLEPGQTGRLTLSGQSFRDLAGRPLDQRPSTAAPDSFTMTFRTGPVVNAALPGVANGRGSVISGNRLYVLDQSAQNNNLTVFDISIPSAPKWLQSLPLLGAPRDIILLPQFSYVLNNHSPKYTNDLVVAVGGDLDTITLDTGGGQAPIVRGRGQYLTVVNVGNPANPQVLASPIVSYRIGSAVTKVRWAPPYLVYEEFGADIQQLGFVNLQELIIGYNSTVAQQQVFPPGGKPGLDLNGDGDYVDVGETLPLPDIRPPEFYGKHQSLVLQHTTQKILDFSVTSASGTVGAVLKNGVQLDNSGQPGQSLPSVYRTLAFRGQILDLSNPTNGALPFGAGAYPRWVTVLDAFRANSNGVPILLPSVALISLTPDFDNTQRLAVVDISLPLQPRLLNKIDLPDALLGGAIQSVALRSDGLLAVAGTQNILLLDPGSIMVTNTLAGQLHPAISGFIPAAGGITRSLGSTDYGVYAVADNGRAVVVQTPPVMAFVSFPDSPSVVDPRSLHVKDDGTLTELLQTMRPLSSLPPARIGTNFDLPSDLQPPNPALHYHVLVRAPGDSGYSFELGLEAVNLAGRPLPNLGNGFAPVRAIASSTQEKLGQTPRANCGAPIRSLTAYRMSDDPHSPFYNIYLSRPFALVCQRISTEQLAVLQQQIDREILFSSFALRTFIEPAQRLVNSVVGPFAGQIDDQRKLIYPVATATAFTVDQSYIMGDNPPPSGGSVKMAGTYGTVSAQSGEFRTDATDMVLPSPRMPISITRAIGSQDTYEGPFGVGWDFNYNQRLTELDPQVFPLGLQMPVIARATKADSEIAGSQDVMFHTGMGRSVLFHWVDTNMPPEYAQDPLVRDFDYAKKVSDYFLPAKHQGVFDLLVKFKDGRFERLTSEGVRYRYAQGGRLEAIIDRYPKNRHDLEYDGNGWLVRIDDRSVSSERFVEFGYYRRLSDPYFNAALDVATDSGFVEGKICRLLDYAGADILFQYSEDGFLTNRLGKLVAGENGGFAGRSQTFYLYKDCHIVGVAATALGVPLFSAVSTANNAGKQVAQSGIGIAGKVQLGVPLENSAATLAGLSASASLADGSSTQYRFDKWGHAASVTTSGSTGPPATVVSSNNEDGLTLFIKYPEGNSRTMTYDSENPNFRSRGNLMTVVVDPGPRGGVGYSESHQYEARYNLLFGPQQDGDGFIATYQLSPDGRDAGSIQHGNAGKETYVYDDNGQVTSSLDLRGVSTGVGYDSGTGFMRTRTRGADSTTYGYDGSYAALLGRPATVTFPKGAPLQIRYNSNLQPVERTRGTLVEKYGYEEQSRMSYRQQQTGDGKQVSTYNLYDQKGFLLSSRSEGVPVAGVPTSLTVTFDPDSVSRVSRIHFPDGAVQSFAYDGRGNVTNMTVGDYREDYTFDLNNNATAVSQGGDLVRQTVYDGLDRAVTVTRKTGTQEETETYTYYPEGQPKTHTLSDSQYGTSLNQSYDKIDEVGRALQFTRLGTTISPGFSYTYAAGSLTEQGPRQTTTRTWNSAGFDTGYQDSILQMTLHPDGNGRVTQIDRQEDGAVYNEFYTYDELDHRLSAGDNLGQRYGLNFRADGCLLAISNALSHTETFDYSALQEPISRQRQDGMTRQMQYDAQRNPTYTGDPAAGFHMGYDGNFRLTNSTLRNGSSMAFTSFDARNMPKTAVIPGGTITLVHDLQRRLTDRTVSYQSTTYQFSKKYDALNRPRVTTYQQDKETLNTITEAYDAAGPLLSARFQEDGADFTVQYGYYGDATRQTITYPSGTVVTEQRDAGGRLTGISDGSGSIFSVVSWQGNGQPKNVKLGTVITIANQYDVRGRLTATRAIRAGVGTPLMHMRYQYDDANNLQVRQFVHRNGKMDNLQFDVAERLSHAQIGIVPLKPAGSTTPLAARTYNYHATGLDYLTSTISTNVAPDLPAFATNWTAHDDFLLPSIVDAFDRGKADPMGNVANAQLQVRPIGGAGSLPVGATLTHNGNGNLVRIARTDGLVEENFFRPDGIRYGRRISQGSTVLDYRHFIYDDGGRLLEEYDRTSSSPSLVARYYYGGSDAPDAADLRDPISKQLRRYYFLKEVDQSIVVVADSAGNAVERAWYDPFGQPVLEQRDTNAPTVRKVIGGDAGSLVVVLSEPVWTTSADPGPGTGIVRYSDQLPNLLTVTLIPTNGPAQAVQGTNEWIANLAGYPAYSAIRFSATQAITGSIRVVLSAGGLQDEWSNTNSAVTLSLVITGSVGTVYYSTQPDLQTSPNRLARSSVGSPFLFHGLYFDYDAGLVYARARFYDPFSGMFLEPDPLGYEDSVNLYAGLRNNPVSMRDPSGASAANLVEEGVNIVSGGEKAVQEEEAVLHTASAAKNEFGDALLYTARNQFVRDATVQRLQGILSNLKMESSILGIVKPTAESLNQSLRETYIAIARTKEFAQAIEKYNRYAEKWAHRGLVKCVTDPEIIIKELENHTFFASQGFSNLKAAFYDFSETGELGKYWMQANPLKSFDLLAMSTGKQTAIHEMLHMGASINGQLEAIRAAGKGGKSIGVWHEIGVQLSSTPGTIGVWGTVFGGLFVKSVVWDLGGELTRPWRAQMWDTYVKPRFEPAPHP